MTTTPQTKYLKDYKPPTHCFEKLHLHFELDDEATKVTAQTQIKRQPTTAATEPLRLYGENLKLLSISLDGRPLNSEDYHLEPGVLLIPNFPEQGQLEVVTEIYPQLNKSLNGLYRSGKTFCTQNEPEGFRQITYSLDRPDVLTIYTTRITANKAKYPIMLSNGNMVGSGELSEGKHWVEWHDPFPKPSYLFALVAGDLGMIQDSFKTKSGRKIDLRLYCDKGNESKCDHAMESLKKAMKWDEERFGLEYDLDIYMIVAVDAFNMGAMENKGLNIFNTSCVLADPATATDYNYARIETVVAHEYFHNWTGNRVTCRDWFQLTLKEGLTVFRDQEFSSDMHSAPVKRIEDVQYIRSAQFPEDSGPTAHPIQPNSYIEINNFYTPTVYYKGAEVIRMIQTIIGREAFRKGMDLYFERFDGQAVTTEDFVKAMEDASGINLTQFRRWYHQAGTPEVEAMLQYDNENNAATLKITQKLPKASNQAEPMHLPLRLGLIGKNSGRELSFCLDPNKKSVKETLLHVTEREQTFHFTNVTEEPLLSLNRNFSAPIRLKSNASTDDLAILMAKDSDPFNRYDASQQLAQQMLLNMVQQLSKGEELKLDQDFVDAFGELVEDANSDSAWRALALMLPSEAVLADIQPVSAIAANHHVREYALTELAIMYKERLRGLYHLLYSIDPYRFTAEEAGRRSLRNSCLTYLMQLNEPEEIERCYKQYKTADNMTDCFHALALLANIDHPYRRQALDDFYNQWQHDTLVMNKWLAAQAASKLPETLEHVKELMQSPVFDITIPNLVRSLLGTFVGNLAHFHAADGSGYTFIADQILKVDPFNPQAAAGLCQGFRRYPKIDPMRQEAMKPHLERILAEPKLSKNVYEVVFKSLEAGKNS